MSYSVLKVVIEVVIKVKYKVVWIKNLLLILVVFIMVILFFVYKWLKVSRILMYRLSGSINKFIAGIFNLMMDKIMLVGILLLEVFVKIWINFWLRNIKNSMKKIVNWFFIVFWIKYLIIIMLKLFM